MSEKRSSDVVIIGGGASGLAAAVTLGMSCDLSVLVIEKMDEPGRKIKATGSGRCNITNTAADGYLDILKFFTRIGLVTRAYENGLVYPYSESAADVAELLTVRARELGTKFSCGEEVVSLNMKDGHFAVKSKFKGEAGEHEVETEAEYVILACGGKAGPMFGTTGDGYRLAKELGHSIVTPVPVLTGIECEEWEGPKELSAIRLAGTRTSGIVSLYKGDIDSPALFQESGEIQFTKYGLSGICVFNMTRHMRYNKGEGEGIRDFSVRINLYPDGNIEDYIAELKRGEFAYEPLQDMFTTLFKKPIAGYITQLIAKEMTNEKKASTPVAELDKSDIRAICEIVHGLKFDPVKLRGWKDAQATSGGVDLSEIDEKTSESRLVPGLYITGELMDRDYQCGGFNLSNAWMTGMAAAEAIASKEK